MAENNKITKNKTIEAMVISAIVIAIMAILNFVPNVGYIRIVPGAFEVTTIHIFVLIFAWLFGWKYGLLSGVFFGVFCFINAFIIGNVAFQNPIVAVIPRIMFGFIAGIGFELLKLIKKPKLRFLFDVIFCGVATLIHTLLVLIAMTLIASTSDVYATFMSYMRISVAINCPGEIGGAVVIVPAVILALDKAFPKYEAVYHGTLKGRKKATIYDTITKNTHE